MQDQVRDATSCAHLVSVFHLRVLSSQLNNCCSIIDTDEEDEGIDSLDEDDSIVEWDSSDDQ